ncbi:MAG: ISL3 family transposase [Methanobrevibacter sp.]|nr:ISL3 family transposase [Methanobrevibacter sp.]
MSQQDIIKELVGLQDIIVNNIEQNEKEINIYLELERKEHKCPCCSGQTSRIHDYRTQKVHDINILGKKVYLILRKRRYVCPNCGKRFYEANSFLPKYHRITNRMTAWIIGMLKTNRSYKDVAIECGLSEFTVARRFDLIGFKMKHLPEVLSIDEFKGDTSGEKYQVILTNPKTHVVLDVLPKRTEHYLTDYFRQFSKEERNKVKYFVCDMYKPYKIICETYFKNAILITDKYHWVRQATWALENVRKRIQKQFGKEKRIYFKHSRSLLTRPYEKLKDEERQALMVMLDISSDLSTVYYLKEQLRNYVLYESDKETARKELNIWIRDAKESEIPELKPAITAFTNWKDSIIASCGQPITNGFTEGCNNKIKVLKRNAYGYRNFERFRKRILFIFAA